jgi:hypothetical protein
MEQHIARGKLTPPRRCGIESMPRASGKLLKVALNLPCAVSTSRSQEHVWANSD